MRFTTLLLSLGLLAGCSAHAQPGYVSMQVAPPPPPRAHVSVGPAPYSGAIWVDGHYVPRRGRYVWVEGYWMRPRPGHVYVAPRWERRGGNYVYVEPGWRSRGSATVRTRGNSGPATVRTRGNVRSRGNTTVVSPGRTTVQRGNRGTVRTRGDSRDTRVRGDDRRRDRRNDRNRNDRRGGSRGSTTVRVR